MKRTYPHIPFERYADDAIYHCKSAEEAQALWSALADRFAACKLVLHPQKTKIVYCKDANRRGDFPNQSWVLLYIERCVNRLKQFRCDGIVESRGGISPPRAPKTVREPLDSHGSRCSAVSMT